LFYVALIESGFSEGAISRAGAAGMWQFMPATARDYGMTVDRWVDERLDWMRATDSAARYFRDSLGAFDNDIELAVASYNTGVGNVRKAMRRGGKNEFWDLRLHPETMDYVPKWIAAMIACNEPKRFGFVVPDDRPVKCESIAIRGSLDLTSVARAIGETPDTVYDLNRALIRRATPPDRAWNVRLPAGSRDRLLANLDNLMQSSSVVWLARRMEKGETLAAAAERYGLTVEQALAANPTLRDHLPEEGEVVMLPVAADNPQAMAEIQRQEEEQRLLASLGAPSPAAATPGGPPPAKPQPRRVSHKVRLADNLWSIAQRYDVEVEDLREWNKEKIGPGDQIRPGQRLTIWLGGEGRPAEEAKYTVRRGDTLAKIAAQQGVELKALAAANHITPDSTIYPGAQLRVPGKGQAKPAPAAPTTHTVGRGETLTSIASRYNVTPTALAASNDLPDPDSLRPGQSLVVPRDNDSPAPAKPAPRAVHVVKPGETLRKIAGKYGVTTKDLAAANDLNVRDDLRVGQRLEVPGKSGARPSEPPGKWVKVKVRRGDTLASLAGKYGCSIADLEAWNGIKRTQPLKAGQTLRVLVR
jgi:membrane-bound lytic murein transglycosylase D